MKKIGAAQRELILDAIGGGLCSLPAGVLEKHLLVTASSRKHDLLPKRSARKSAENNEPDTKKHPGPQLGMAS